MLYNVSYNLMPVAFPTYSPFPTHLYLFIYFLKSYQPEIHHVLPYHTPWQSFSLSLQNKQILLEKSNQVINPFLYQSFGLRSRLHGSPPEGGYGLWVWGWGMVPQKWWNRLIITKFNGYMGTKPTDVHPEWISLGTETGLLFGRHNVCNLKDV